MTQVNIIWFFLFCKCNAKLTVKAKTKTQKWNATKRHNIIFFFFFLSCTKEMLLKALPKIRNTAPSPPLAYFWRKTVNLNPPKIYNYISFSVIKLGCKCSLQFKKNLGFFSFTKLNSFTTKSTLRQFIIRTVSHWGLRTVKLLLSCQRQFLWVRWTITHHLSHISKPSIACRLTRVSSQKWAEENCVKEIKPEIMS